MFRGQNPYELLAGSKDLRGLPRKDHDYEFKRLITSLQTLVRSKSCAYRVEPPQISVRSVRDCLSKTSRQEHVCIAAFSVSVNISHVKGVACDACDACDALFGNESIDVDSLAIQQLEDAVRFQVRGFQKWVFVSSKT